MTMHRLNATATSTAKSFILPARNIQIHSPFAPYSLGFFQFRNRYFCVVCAIDDVSWCTFIIYHFVHSFIVLLAVFFSAWIFIVVYASFIKIDSQSQFRSEREKSMWCTVHTLSRGHNSYINKCTHTRANSQKYKHAQAHRDYCQFFATINSHGCATPESIFAEWKRDKAKSEQSKRERSKLASFWSCYIKQVVYRRWSAFEFVKHDKLAWHCQIPTPRFSQSTSHPAIHPSIQLSSQRQKCQQQNQLNVPNIWFIFFFFFFLFIFIHFLLFGFRKYFQ